jgi:ABC-type nitrate/sulfonate/bicarbonate transport system permease component
MKAPGIAMQPRTVDSTEPAAVDDTSRHAWWRVFWARQGRRLLGLVAVIVAGALWQLLATKDVLNPSFTSSPSGIYSSAVSYFGPGGGGWGDLATSAQEFAWGFLLSIAIGLPLGILAGWYGWFDAVISPFVTFFNNSPRIALAPLFVIWFGLGITSKVAVVFLSAVLPIIMSARGGVKTVDEALTAMAKSYGASDLHVLRTVILPGTVPAISSGIRIAIGQALLGVVLAEYIASTQGLGFTVVTAASTFDTNRLFVAVLVISLLGVAAGAVLGSVERYFDKWRT